MSLKQTTQPEPSDYEKKRPVFERHKAIIVQILLHDPLAHSPKGLTDDQVADFLATFLRNESIQLYGKPHEGRKKPTVDNRLRDLASENRIVRIKGFDGLKHNFHPDIFLSMDPSLLRPFFLMLDCDEWRKRVK